MWWIFILVLTFGANEYELTTLELQNILDNVPYLSDLISLTGSTPLWFTLGMIGVMIAFFISLLLRGMGQLLNSPQIISLGNIELREFVFSFFLLVGLYLFIVSLDQIVNYILINIVSSDFSCSDNRLQCITDYVIQKTIENQDRLLEYIKISFRSSSAKYSSSNEVFGLTIKLQELLHPTFQYSSGFKNFIAEEGIYNEALNTLSLGSGVVAFLKFLFYFLGPLGISLGAILRPLPITRRIGATLLALGIGFYLLLPAVLALLYSFPPELTPVYNNNQCPALCKDKISAFTGSGSNISEGLESQNVSRLLSEALKRNIDDDPSNDVAGGPTSSYDLTEFLFGNKETLTGYDADTNTPVSLTSCEYVVKNIPPASLSAIVKKKAKDLGITMEYCPAICRQVPYPYNNPQCYFANSACQKLWETYPACFKKTYDLNLLNINVRLVNGEEKKLKDYLKESNCFTIQPLTPGPEDYTTYCPVTCKAYFNELVWSDFTQDEIETYINGNLGDKLNILYDKIGESFLEVATKAVLNNWDPIIQELINGSTPSMHPSDILITCGAMFNDVNVNDGGVCYGDGTNIATVWTVIKQHTSRGGSENDTYVQNNVESIFPGQGADALEIAKMSSKPSSEINDIYPIFNEIYNNILNYGSPNASVILNEFRSRMIDKINSGYNSLDVYSDPDFGGQAYSKTFSNIWDDSYLDALAAAIEAKKGNTLNLDQIESIAEKSPTYASLINQMLDGVESVLKIEPAKYGVCDPKIEYTIGCAYEDNSFCAQTKNCSVTYSIKYDNAKMPDEVWQEVIDNLDSMNEVKLWTILEGVYLPIKPRVKDCSLSSSVNPDLLRFPPSPDCSKCNNYDVFELKNAVNTAALEIGKYNFRMFVLPLFGVYLTIIGIIGLSQLLGGEIFIPGLTRVR